MNEKTETSGGRGELSYIHAKFDDYGLDPLPYRIACRLLRRAGAEGFCYESIGQIGRGCRICPNTVRKWLDYLVSIGMFRVAGLCASIEIRSLPGSEFTRSFHKRVKYARHSMSSARRCS